MTTITIENVPETFINKLGDKIDFNNILGIYWDGIDWCQYDEVIPDKDDKLASKNYKKNLSDINGKDFLLKLISN